MSACDVHEVYGNHAYQDTALNRPILARHPEGGKRNLLRSSEDGTGADWSRTSVTVELVGQDEGGDIIQKITFAGAAGDFTRANFISNVLVQGIESFMIRADSPTQIRLGWTNAGTSQFIGPVVDVTTDWQMVEVIRNPTGSGWSGAIIANNSLGNSNPVYVKKWQAEVGAIKTAFQRTKAGGFDVTEAGVPDIWHLYNDGGDSLLVTLPAGTYGRAYVDAFGNVTADTVTDPSSLLAVQRQVAVIFKRDSFTEQEINAIRAIWERKYGASP